MGKRDIDEEAFHEDSPSPPSSKHLNEKGDDGLQRRQSSLGGRANSIANAKIQNPLAGMTQEELITDVESFCKEKDLMYAIDDFQKGALLAQYKGRYEMIESLSEEEKELIRREKTHRWTQPKMMYYMTSKAVPMLWFANSC